MRCMEQKKNKTTKNSIKNKQSEYKLKVASLKIKKKSKQSPEEYGRKFYLLEWLTLDIS